VLGDPNFPNTAPFAADFLKAMSGVKDFWQEPTYAELLLAMQKRVHDYVVADIGTAQEALDKLIAALKGMRMDTPFGPIEYRSIDHQSTMGAYVGRLARRNGEGVMVNWRYADGADFLPADDVVRALRKE